MLQATPPASLDERLRHFQWKLAQFVWRSRGWPGQAEREMSARAYEEGKFSLSAAYLREALRKSGGDHALRLEMALWARYGMVDFSDARAMLLSVTKRGLPELARQAAPELLDLVWERKGAIAAAQLLPQLRRWLDDTGKNGLRLAALMHEAGQSDEALDLFKAFAHSHPDLVSRIGYLELVLMADRAGFGPLPQAKAARRMSARLRAGAKRMNELLADGEGIAVVANGTTLRDKGLGSAIDAHRLVMRFNNHEGGADILDQGARTDIWLRPLPLTHVPWKPSIPDPEIILLIGSNVRNRFSTAIQRFRRFPKTTADIAVLPTSLYLNLFRRLEASPSSGVLGLSLVAKKSGGKVEKSRVFGYSLYENTEDTSHYHGGVVKGSTPSRHNWVAEQKLFSSLLGK